MLRLVRWLLALLVALLIWIALRSPPVGNVVALPLGTRGLWTYTDRQVIVVACPRHDLIRIWPLPVISPWFEDPFDPLIGQPA